MDTDVPSNSSGQHTAKFKVQVKIELDAWFGIDKYNVLFCWYDNNVAYVTVQSGNDIFFERLFTVDDNVVLSQDKVYHSVFKESNIELKEKHNLQRLLQK